MIFSPLLAQSGRGSVFSADGQVIHGPATKPLPVKQLPKKNKTSSAVT